MSLKKIFFSVGVIFSLFAVSAKADVQDYLLEKTKESINKMSYSDTFLKALEQCRPLKENGQNMGVNTSYEIKGWNNKECLIENISEMQGLEEIVRCHFSAKKLKEFIAAQRGIKKMLPQATSIQEIVGNEHYAKASKMLMDKKNCTNKHSAFDQYKELRENLKKCSPYQKKIDMLGRGTMTMKIIGPKAKKCNFILEVLMKAPSAEEVKKIWGEDAYQKMKDSIKDTNSTIKCEFSEENKNKFIELLAKTEISADDSINVEMLQEKQNAQKEAFEFLSTLPDCQRK